MNEKFTTVIQPKNGWFELNLKELFKYKDLIILFVKRNFTSQYKQTILGPAWAIIQPFVTTVIFTLVFGNIAGLAPAGVPTFLFYLSANIVWQYFSGCLTMTSSTFTANAAILGKVYFPRLVMPISSVISQLIPFAIQLVFFLIFWVYYLVVPSGVEPNLYILLFPLIIIQLAMLGLGFGVIISACTTKYRDLAMAVGFGTQLWMYATPIAYDISIIPEKYLSLYMLNPVTPAVMAMRYAFLGTGYFNLKYYLISWIVTIVVLFIGVVLFSRIEKTFADTV